MSDIAEVIRSHQPCGGGYGVSIDCLCGHDYSVQHQLEKLADAGHVPMQLSRREELAGELAGGKYGQVPASLQEAIDRIIELEARS